MMQPQYELLCENAEQLVKEASLQQQIWRESLTVMTQFATKLNDMKKWKSMLQLVQITVL